MNAYSSFIFNCWNLDATKTSFSRWWINTQRSIQTMKYYSALKRKELPTREKTWWKLKCILLSEERPPEKATHSGVTPALWPSGKGEVDSEKINSSKGLTQRDSGFLGQGKHSVRYYNGHMSLYIVRTPSMYPKVHDRFGLIMMCQHGLTRCNICTTLAEAVDKGGGSAPVGTEYTGALCTFLSISLNLSCSTR